MTAYEKMTRSSVERIAGNSELATLLLLEAEAQRKMEDTISQLKGLKIRISRTLETANSRFESYDAEDAETMKYRSPGWNTLGELQSSAADFDRLCAEGGVHHVNYADLRNARIKAEEAI